MDAAIGFRSKTGRAIVVALAAGSRAPELIFRREISLIDPRSNATKGPYHEVMELPWAKAVAAARKSVSMIETVAARALEARVDELTRDAFQVRTLGIVGSPDSNLEKIGNPHIRAHAAEGILFRHALEVAAERNKLPFQSFSDRTISAESWRFDARLKILGKQAGAPWRTDEKNAATAAWLALSDY
jgi:hypothetical protein